MQIIRLTVDERVNLQALLGQKILAVDVPEGDVSSGSLSMRNISNVRLTCEDDKFTFFSVRSIDLVKGVEVFLVEIATFLDLRRYPGGPPITWHPIAALAEELRGCTIENFRLLKAVWKVVAGNSVEGTYYGKHPLFLTYDLSDDATTFHVEDGIILFFSSGSALTLCATGDLPGTLRVWHSRA